MIRTRLLKLDHPDIFTSVTKSYSVADRQGAVRI
jgi:hypothetical protein